MRTFRAKLIPYPQWQDFSTRFDKLFTLWKATPRTALFREKLPPRESGLLLITSFRADEIEALSPGGWSDLSDPSDRKWMLLVGRAGATKHFGLEPIKKDGMFG